MSTGLTKVQHALNKVALATSTASDIKAKTPEDFCSLCAKCSAENRTDRCAKNLIDVVGTVLGLNEQVDRVHAEEVLCDDVKYRTDEKKAYIDRVTPLMEKLEPGDGLRKLVQGAIDRMTKDDGLGMMQYRKDNLSKHRAELISTRSDYIIEKEKEELEDISYG